MSPRDASSRDLNAEPRSLGWLRIIVLVVMWGLFVESFFAEARLTTKLRIQQTERELCRSLTETERGALTVSTWEAVCHDRWGEYYERAAVESAYRWLCRKKNR